jgi:hypothetical protein
VIVEAHEDKHENKAEHRGSNLADDEVIRVVEGLETNGKAGAVDEDQADNDKGNGRDEDGIVWPSGVKAAGLVGHGRAPWGRRDTRARKSAPRASKFG